MKKFFGIFIINIMLFANSIAQHKADKIQDSRLIVQAHDTKLYCLSPKSVDGRMLISMQDCKNASIARYDVYKRLAFKHNDSWLCASLGDRMKAGKMTSDYIELKPCVLNDDSQWFEITKDAFSLRAFDEVKITEKNFLLVGTRNNFGNKIHAFEGVMKEWLEAIAPPVNYAVKTPIYFYVEDRQSGIRTKFYLGKNSASKNNITNFYYDITSGKIALYNNGDFECLKTNLDNKDFSYLNFSKCNFQDRQREFAWNLNFFDGSFIFDGKNNILDVARGSDFGRLFVVTKDYYKKNLAASSLKNTQFFFDSVVYDVWNFNYRNAGFNSHKCGDERRVKRELSNFYLANFNILDDNWIRRFYAISRTSDSSEDASGICGICMLQTFEIVSLLTQVYPYNVDFEYNNNGYLFDYSEHTSPFVSLQRRNPALYNLMGEALNLWGQEFVFGEPLYHRGVRAIWALTRNVLPRLEWSLSSVYTGADIGRELIRLTRSPAGSLYIALVSLSNNRAHAIPIVITNHGVVVIPTNNENMSEQEFLELVRPANNLRSLELAVTANGRYQIEALTIIGLVGNRDNVLGEYLNQFDCTGDGSFRRGNGNFLNPNNANMCGNSRCDLMEIDFTLSH